MTIGKTSARPWRRPYEFPAGLLAWLPLRRPPSRHCQWVHGRQIHLTALGTRRIRTAFPILPLIAGTRNRGLSGMKEKQMQRLATDDVYPRPLAVL